MNSITKRWIRNNLSVTIILLIIVQIVAAFFVRDSYYSAAQTLILNRIASITGAIDSSVYMENEERFQLLLNTTQDFSEKEKFAFMLIGEDGNILSTSTGFLPSDNMHEEDIKIAADTDDGIYTNDYITDMNEHVLSSTSIIYPTIQDAYAIRLVTSLEKIDNEISIVLVFIFLASVIVVIFYLISGMYFIRSIVNPMQEIEKTAQKIAKGEFDVRIQHSYTNEMGSLCDTINEMAEDLAKSDEIKNEFISSISHELRTPLTAIKGWTETINHNDKENFYKGKNIILSETERLYAMVENLLDFSRMQQAEISLTKERLDLVAEIEDVVLMFNPRCEMAGVSLEFLETMDIVPIYADKNRLKQVFINILDNSLKYSKQDSKIEITLDYKKSEKQAEIKIKDYGKGIHPEDLKKVTQKFYKGKGAKRGSGIGLALVNEIIEAHGGSFFIESEYKKSTTAIITLNTISTMKSKRV